MPERVDCHPSSRRIDLRTHVIDGIQVTDHESEPVTGRRLLEVLPRTQRKVVDPDYATTLSENRVGEMAADEASGSCDDVQTHRKGPGGQAPVAATLNILNHWKRVCTNAQIGFVAIRA